NSGELVVIASLAREGQVPGVARATQRPGYDVLRGEGIRRPRARRPAVLAPVICTFRDSASRASTDPRVSHPRVSSAQVAASAPGRAHYGVSPDPPPGRRGARARTP